MPSPGPTWASSKVKPSGGHLRCIPQAYCCTSLLVVLVPAYRPSFLIPSAGHSVELLHSVQLNFYRSHHFLLPPFSLVYTFREMTELGSQGRVPCRVWYTLQAPGSRGVALWPHMVSTAMGPLAGSTEGSEECAQLPPVFLNKTELILDPDRLALSFFRFRFNFSKPSS